MSTRFLNRPNRPNRRFPNSLLRSSLRWLPQFALLLALTSPPVAAGTLLLQDARVVDVESGAILGRDVLLRDDHIAALAAPGQQAERADKTLDLEGRFMIPGLWDMHVHFEGRELVEDNALLLPVYLAYGITAVRDAAGNLASTVLA